MIPFQVRKYLDLGQPTVRDFLYMVFPSTAVEDSGIVTWVETNKSRAVVDYYDGTYYVLEINDLGLDILTATQIDYAITNGATLKSKKVPIGVVVNTTMLDADVPVGYSPGRETITETIDSEEVTRQKTVEELMVCIRGTEGSSVILCAEKTNGGNGTGLVHEEFLRFKDQFTTYQVFTDAQLAAWKASNITGGEV